MRLHKSISLPDLKLFYAYRNGNSVSFLTSISAVQSNVVAVRAPDALRSQYVPCHTMASDLTW